MQVAERVCPDVPAGACRTPHSRGPALLRVGPQHLTLHLSRSLGNGCLQAPALLRCASVLYAASWSCMAFGAGHKRGLEGL